MMPTIEELNAERYAQAKRAQSPEFVQAQLLEFRVVNRRFKAKWGFPDYDMQLEGKLGRLLPWLDRWAPR